MKKTNEKYGNVPTNLIKIISTPSQPKLIHLASINTRSISNKINQFQPYLLEKSRDICAVTETWLKEDDEHGLHEIPSFGYKIISRTRCDGRQGGGIALIYRENYTINDHKIDINSGCIELSAFDLCIHDCVITLLVIYRYPNTSVIFFCNDLADTLENNIHALRCHCILTSNFNILLYNVLLLINCYTGNNTTEHYSRNMGDN